MTPQQQASNAAFAELLALGMPRPHATALASAMHRGATAILDLVDERYRERAANPRAWAVFHETMADTLPRWRVFARAHHRRMGRRYRAMQRAGTAVPCG